jgi:hypothetical protein
MSDIYGSPQRSDGPMSQETRDALIVVLLAIIAVASIYSALQPDPIPPVQHSLSQYQLERCGLSGGPNSFGDGVTLRFFCED